MTKLKNILYKKNITQSALAKALDKDPATINRWCENSRLISWNNALNAAEYLKCHPTEIFNDTSLAKIELFCDSECYVECTSFEEDHQKIKVHFEDANKIFVYNNSYSIERGFHIFDNKDLMSEDDFISPASITTNKMYLIYLINTIYCGYINIDSSGNFYVFNSNNFKTDILGKISQIQNLYQRTGLYDA